MYNDGQHDYLYVLVTASAKTRYRRLQKEFESFTEDVSFL